MNVHKTIMITSCKGGVGKSTVTANLGFALAKAGHRTLLADCDFGNRCLDLILGCEDSMLYDITDVASGEVEMSRAAVTDRRSPNLFAVTAPPTPRSGELKLPSKEALRAAFDRAAEEMELDFILIDTPGALGEILETTAFCADSALIVTTHQPTAIRAADNTASVLSDMGVQDSKMIINCFDPATVLSGDRPGVIDIIDRAFLPTAGVVPYDLEFSLAGERGNLAYECKTYNVTTAFDNIAKRLCGKNVPLFSGFKKFKRRKFIL